MRSIGLEPLEERVLLAVDFGDAPEPYPVLESEDGARHTATGPTLGASRDMEDDGVHSTVADGDGADEDGVTFGTIFVGQTDASVTVEVQGSDAKLDAWIDFDGDGNWGGPGEQIADSVSVQVGDDNLVHFDVPSWAKPGATYARFRVNTAGDLGIGGEADDGEVEDYRVTLDPPAPGGTSFEPHTISADEAYGAITADIDGDGDLDVVAASDYEASIVWYENDGSGNFTSTHTISTTAYGVRNPFAADLDGDGDLDVLGPALDDDTIAWYENDGGGNFANIHIISVTAFGALGVFAADVDGDGDLDVLAALHDSNTVAWYANDGSGSFAPAQAISTDAPSARAVVAADVDGDGDLDALAAIPGYGQIAWYENDGSGDFSTTHSIAGSGSMDVFAADIDRDGDIDILSASFSKNEVVWSENDGSGGFITHTITDAAEGAESVFAADVDGDGDLDVLSASANDDTIAWYENAGSGNFTTTHTISTTANRALRVLAADVNGDGVLDVLSTAIADSTITWYENLVPDLDFGDAPQFYPTLASENGARHVATGPTLGPSRDSETDGTHTDNADGDGGDEDGVTFGTIFVGQTDASVTVEMQGADAKLDAWIDFDGDGNWGAPGEQIAASVPVHVGDDNVVHFDVPSWAKPGATYARFRVSTAGNLGVGGLTDDGEVEDFVLTIDPPERSSGEFGGPNLIAQAAVNNLFDAVTADLDGDGDQDVLAALYSDDTIAWYENDGTGEFTPRVVSTEVDAPKSVFAADLDGDGDLDVLCALSFDDTIAWFQNDGSGNFTRHVVTDELDLAARVFAADLDGDGDVDVLSASYRDGTVAWHENDGSGDFAESHAVTGDAFGAWSVLAADLDGDGDLDVLAAPYSNNTLAWYRNDGSGNFAPQTVDNDTDGVIDVFAADVDGDGDLDIVSAAYRDGTTIWYKNDGSGNFSPRTIETALDGPIAIYAADLNGDRTLDVLSGELDSGRLAWYANPTGVNHAPDGANGTSVLPEDTTYTFTATDFGFSDPDDSPANSLLAVRIATLPAAGSLTLGGVAVAAGQFVSAADIASGQLRFAPAANAVGTPYTSFTFQVQDDGGTQGGGVDLDPTPNAMTLNVTPVNDAPEGAGRTISVAESDAYALAPSDFGFSDPLDSPSNSLAAVRIATLPSGGQLTNDHVAVVAGQTIAAADIAAGRLVFTPGVYVELPESEKFTFQVQDNGGTADGGSDLDPTPGTMTFRLIVSPDYAFVRGLYEDILKRPAKTGGMITWTNLMQNGASRQEIVRRLWETPEHRGLQVDGYFQTFLHRDAKAAGRQHWINLMVGGMSEEEVMVAFIGTMEYQLQHPTHTELVIGVFQDVLGRDPKPKGQADWVHSLDKWLTPTVFAWYIVNSRERHLNLVDDYFEDFYGDDPDASEKGDWADLLDVGLLDEQSLAEALLSTPKYYLLDH